MRIDIGRRDRVLVVPYDREEGGQQPRHACQPQRRCGRIGRSDLDCPEGALERCREVELWIGESRRSVEIEPRHPFDEDGPVGCRRLALIGQLERRRAPGREQDRRSAVRIERPEPLGVGGLDREQLQRSVIAADRHRPAAAQRVDGAGNGARITQKTNSVTSGTWSDGLSHDLHGSQTLWLTALSATSRLAHI
jgi:hypothetical protein